MNGSLKSAATYRPVLDSALDAIGDTPLIRLDRFATDEGIKCNLFGKVEFFNAGGSVKDRIAKRMVIEAEKDGKLHPGQSVVIEPTSGNTGIGLALACALRGYPVIITLPEKMSLEKEVTMRALGAEIIRTPTDAAHDSPLSNIGVAKRLEKLIPGGVILDQYANPNNPDAHYHGTGKEIVSALHAYAHGSSPSRTGRVDAFIAGAGTGGTVTGVSRALKEANENVHVVAVDPVGSVMALPESLNELKEGQTSSYLVEGIGYDFIPDVFDRSSVDTFIKTSDDETWTAARKVMKLEGLLVGGSSGSAIAGCLQWLRESELGRKLAEDAEANVVVLLPDGIRNYMSKPWFKDALDAEPQSDLSKLVKEKLGSSLGLGAFD